MNLQPRLLNKYKPFEKNEQHPILKLLFENTIYTHFPVVKNKVLMGLHQRNEVLEANINHEDDAKNQKLSHFYVYEDSDVLEVMREFSLRQSNLLPVLDKNQNYLGYYELADIIKGMKEAPFLNSQGIVLILQKDLNNYSFSEVCQIIESNKGKIYGFFVSKLRENHVEILIKFESHQINETIQLFRNYDYSVLSVHEEDTFLQEFEKRSDYLRKYLKM